MKNGILINTHIKYKSGKFKTGSNNKRGYIILEAAIFMPIFIIAVVLLCFAIKFGIVYESAYSAMVNETRCLVRDMYAGEEAGLVGPLSLKSALDEKVPELESSVTGLVVPFPFFQAAEGVKLWSAGFEVGFPFSREITQSKGFSIPCGGEISLAFRPFVGKDNSLASFDDPEKDEDYVEVWVFPRAGEKYHCKDCRFITNYPKQYVLTAGLKLRYSPCKLCGARSLHNGSIVYCFDSEGKKYHSATCSLVDKYVISMDKKDAEAKGYTPCKVCGGCRQ